MTATRRARDEIRARIFDLRLAPNEHRLESELATELGMSRTPVREACLQLQSEGLVDVVPRRGVRVRPVSPDDLAEIYDVIGVLEARAAELAAERDAGDLDLTALDDAVGAMQAALAADDLDGWALADDRFHHELVVASGNGQLVDFAGQLADRVRRARLVTLRLRPVPTGSVADHAELVELIRDGDGAAAHRRHLEHRRATGRTLVELVRRHRLGVV